MAPKATRCRVALSPLPHVAHLHKKFSYIKENRHRAYPGEWDSETKQAMISQSVKEHIPTTEAIHEKKKKQVQLYVGESLLQLEIKFL